MTRTFLQLRLLSKPNSALQNLGSSPLLSLLAGPKVNSVIDLPTHIPNFSSPLLSFRDSFPSSLPDHASTPALQSKNPSPKPVLRQNKVP